MNYDKVVFVFVIGGVGMVKLVYFIGKFVLGVGLGNVLVYIDKIVKIKCFVNDIIFFKFFD